MSFPNFYDAARVGKLFVPDSAAVIDAGQAAGVKPASADDQKTMLVLVDAQVDFVHEDGALSVPGAVDDTRRTIEWMFANLERVTTIVASLDSHVPLQIFYPMWWVNADGQHPTPYTSISVEDVDQGVWRPTVEVEWSVQYVHRLAEQARKTLMIWPYHTMIGTPGHTITPALYEAIAYHSAARQAEPVFYRKGTIAKTEHYSILEPEVKVVNEPAAQLNVALLELFTTYDRIYVAGQAKSHCVLETVTSMVRYFGTYRPDMVERLYLLEDCMSSVVHPEIDFEALACAELEKYAEMGVHLVMSGDS